MKITPARVATAVGVLAGVAGAVAPVIANADWTSTAGIEAGALLVVGTICNFLIGQRQHEARQAVPTVRAAPLSARNAPIPPVDDVLDDPPVGAEGPPADLDRDPDVPNPNPDLGKPELDDPEWKPAARKRTRSKR